MSDGVILLLLGEFFSIIGLLITNLVQNKSAEKKRREEIEELKEHQTETYLGMLRLTIVSEEMPIPERIIAGRKYTSAGGNGEVKKIYQKMIEEHTK